MSTVVDITPLWVPLYDTLNGGPAVAFLCNICWHLDKPKKYITTTVRGMDAHLSDRHGIIAQRTIADVLEFNKEDSPDPLWPTK